VSQITATSESATTQPERAVTAVDSWQILLRFTSHESDQNVPCISDLSLQYFNHSEIGAAPYPIPT
jgi:hypothetical protein